LAIELDIICWCTLFGIFGIYRNLTENTEIEQARYRMLFGTDQFPLCQEPKYGQYRITEPIGSVIPNAQSDRQSPLMTQLPHSPGSTLVLKLNQETIHDFI
jgi:hypothetical protein